MSEATVPVAVLIAGDGEADLGRIATTISVPGQIARGIASACLALRTASYGVVVADVASSDDALAILRASSRGRPAPRVVCLLPADDAGSNEATRLLSGSSFAVQRHPLPPGLLDRLVGEAAADYRAERDGRPVPVAPARERSAAESYLVEALHEVVWQLTGVSGNSAVVDAMIDRCVEAASTVVRDRTDGDGMLLAMAEALKEGAGVRVDRSGGSLAA